MGKYFVEWSLRERGEFVIYADSEAEAREIAYDRAQHEEPTRSDLDVEVYES
jgi:hypothetical protein